MMVSKFSSSATRKRLRERSILSNSGKTKKSVVKSEYPLDSATRYDTLADCQCKIELDGDCTEILTNFDTIKGNVHFQHKRQSSTGTIMSFKSFRIQLEGIAQSKDPRSEDRFLPDEDSESSMTSLCVHFIKSSLPAHPQFEFSEDSDLQSFPFEILLTGQTLPASFEDENCKISYVLVVYGCLFGDVECVAADKVLTTMGCVNLSSDPELSTPLVFSTEEKSKSFFSKQKRGLKVQLCVNKRGFLPGENLQWQIQITNPQSETVRNVQVTLVRKFLYFVDRTSKSAVNVLENQEVSIDKNDDEMSTEGDILIPGNLIPSFIRGKAEGKCLEILYLVQFVIEVTGQAEPVSGETIIVIGTGRDDSDDTRRDSKESHDTAGSSMMTMDWDTLPPLSPTQI